MAPRLSVQTSIFGVVFFVSKSLLGIEGQRKLEKFTVLTRKPRSHARILIYRTWPIATEKVSRIRSNIIWNRWKSTLKEKSIRVNLNQGTEMQILCTLLLRSGEILESVAWSLFTR